MVDRLGHFVEDRLFNSAIRRRDFFDYDFINQLLKAHRAGKANYSFFLWSLLNLSLWYDQWIEGNGERPAGKTRGKTEEAAVAQI
jgi:hypothetical protein